MAEDETLAGLPLVEDSEAPREALDVSMADGVVTEAAPEAARDPAPEAARDQARMKHVNGRAQSRIEDLSRRTREAESSRDQYAQTVSELHQLAQRLADEKAQSDRAMVIHYSHRLDTELKFLQRQLEDAISIGDARKQAELQQSLAALSADRSAAASWQTAGPQQPARQAAPVPQMRAVQPAGDGRVELRPEVEEWVRANPYMDRGSEYYAPEVAQSAVHYAQLLEERMRRQGREAEIGTPSYFSKIDTFVRLEHPDMFEEGSAPPAAASAAPVAPPRMRGSGSQVAAAVNRSPPGASVRAGSTVRLSVDEQRMAFALASSRALPLPPGVSPSDKPAVLAAYARFVEQDRRRITGAR